MGKIKKIVLRCYMQYLCGFQGVTKSVPYGDTNRKIGVTITLFNRK
jgi:hypothetical protein